MNNVWLITGATRGLGVEIARAALAAGERVVATGRRVDAIIKALGSDAERLLGVKLDVTVPEQAVSAVNAAVERFGRIDVLVNNAGYGQLGMFEESSSSEAEQQYRVNVFGAMNVLRAVLPIMRRQRSGHIFNISSIAGLRGERGASLYSSTKFALAGLSESLTEELAQFGIQVTTVEPGFFRTDFLDNQSMKFGGGSISDYAEESQKMQGFFVGRNHQQAGDPAKLAYALLNLASQSDPPRNFVVGTDAVAVMEARIERDRKELERWRVLSSSTDLVHSA